MEVTGKKTNPRFGTQGPIASFQKLLETLKAQHREQPLAGSCTVAVHQLVSGEWLHCRYSIYMCVCVIIIAFSFPSSSFIIINDFYLNLQLLLFFQFSPCPTWGEEAEDCVWFAAWRIKPPQQPLIPVLDMLSLVLKIHLSFLCLTFHLHPTPWHCQWL